MTNRRRISTRERLAIFEREKGVCHLCGGFIQAGEAWDVSHDIPLEMGGADEGENLKAAHRKCHREHTAKVDAPRIAKTKRIAARHIGALQPKKLIRGRGFPKKEKAPRIEKQALPPRPMFTEMD